MKRAKGKAMKAETLGQAKRRQREAKAYLDAHYTEIMMHTLYQRWGLPTRLLKPILAETFND